MLIRNNVEYEPKPIFEGKEKEGYMTLVGTRFLSESKKLYSYQLPSIDFLFSTQEDFLKLWYKNPLSLNVHITANEGTENKMVEARKLFAVQYKEIFNTLKIDSTQSINKDVRDKENNVIGTIIIDPYHLGLFEHQKELTPAPAVNLSMGEPCLRIMNGQNLIYHPTQYYINVSLEESKNVDAFIDRLDKKRKSQKELSNMPRIFFFDNEVYKGMEPRMFPGGRITDDSKIVDYINSKVTDDIICIIFRDYSFNTLPR